MLTLQLLQRSEASVELVNLRTWLGRKLAASSNWIGTQDKSTLLSKHTVRLHTVLHVCVCVDTLHVLMRVRKG